MDEDGFTQVKRKDRKRSSASGGQRAGQGSGQNAPHKRGGQHANKSRGNPQAGRAGRNGARDDAKRPGRGRPGGQAPAGPRGEAQPGRVCQTPDPSASFRTMIAPLSSSNLVHPHNGRRQASPKGSKNGVSPRKGPQRFAEVAAAPAHIKSDATSILSVHSTQQTPTSLVEGAASPCRLVATATPGACSAERATVGGVSGVSTPSAASSAARSPKSVTTSWAALMKGRGPGHVSPRKNSRTGVTSPTQAAVVNEAQLPPNTGHPELRVNTEQHLAVRSATPATTAAASSCSGAAAPEPDTADSDGNMAVECAALVASEATETGSSSGSRFQQYCGFKNPHNMCFANAALQAALSTQPFRKLMENLETVGLHLPEGFEVLRGLAELVKEWTETPVDQAVSTEDLKKIVDEFNELEGFKGSKGDSPFTVARQQPQLDSALLYSTMIDLICEELKKVLKAFSTDDCFMAAGQDNSEWKMSTRKGNAAVQGMQHVAGQRCTPFAEACRGVTASSHRTAQGASVMLEPFTMLHVRPLQNGQDTVEAGVDRLFERNVDDVSGSHQTLILEAPQVLVIQVGRFTYEPEVGRTVKVKCPVHHPQTLDLKPEWFAQNAPIKRATYQLVAKVVHKGEQAENGHYITVARRCDQWIVCDDATVMPALESEVMQGDAYMLFYEMCASR